MQGELTSYCGRCHCGAVRFEAKLDLTQPVIACNCSICRKKGTLLSFMPQGLTLLQGEDALTTYRFASGTIAHRFCNTCGVQSFAEFKNGGAAVNVRTLDDVDPDRLTVQPFDGASVIPERG